MPQPNQNTNMVEKLLASEKVNSTLDRINLSDRKWTILSAAIAKANNEEISKSVLSSATIRRRRQAYRAQATLNIQNQFASTDKPPLIVHWDGKKMKDATGTSEIARKKFITSTCCCHRICHGKTTRCC